MSRLEKKCFIASAALHGLLGLVLLVGPGFLSPERQINDFEQAPILEISTQLTDGPSSGGGKPAAAPPAAMVTSPALPPPRPAPEKMQQKEPAFKPQPTVKADDSLPDPYHMRVKNKPKPD